MSFAPPLSLAENKWMQNIKNLFRPSETTLLSPLGDIVMAGGASIVFFFILSFFVRDTSTFNTWAIAMYYAAFLVNYPHFMSSYQLLYRDGRRGFANFSHDRFLTLKLWWAGCIVPLLLIGYFLYALGAGDEVAMGYLASAMYFFVGWHYVKQIYGCMIVLSSAKKVYYNAYERWAILVTLYSLWAVSFIASNLHGGQNMYYQIPYAQAEIPIVYFNTALVLLVGGTGALVCLLLAKYLRTKTYPPLSALTALVSIFLWFVPFYIWFPGFSNQYFAYIIPFFHSLQYLLFVLAYKRNWAIQNEGDAREEIARRTVRSRLTLWGFAQYIGLPIVVVLLVMYTKYEKTFETILYSAFASLHSISLETQNVTYGLITLLTIILVASFYWARKNAYGKFNLFFICAYILGVTLFTLIPNTLDLLAHNNILPQFLSYDRAIFGGSLYLFFFIIFVNIHHYFIDNVIWRRDNPHIREYLFTR